MNLSFILDQMVKDGMNTVLCYACGLRIFKALAYSYRKNIPKDQLPGNVIELISTVLPYKSYYLQAGFTRRHFPLTF